MVWEQGSVVIVTLTRLADNGVSLCHRYWPEEGSELHHIYEVILSVWKQIMTGFRIRTHFKPLLHLGALGERTYLVR